MSYSHSTAKIPKRLLTSLVPAGTASGQYKFNHTDCSAGEDTKHRLYIKVPDATPWQRVAYCHNCGGSGFAVLRNDSVFTPLPKEPLLGQKFEDINVAGFRAPYVPAGVKGMFSGLKGKSWSPEKYLDEMPGEAKAILAMAGITREEIGEHKICFDTDTQRLLYPTFVVVGKDEDGDPNYKIAQVQSKAIYRNQAPKYYTVYDKTVSERRTDVLRMPKDIIVRPHNTLVIVEDLLSAIRVNRQHNVLPICGTHLKTEHLFQYARKYKTICVWLDNDSEVVIEQARDIVRTVQMVGSARATMVLVARDPKYCDDDQIGEYIDKAKEYEEE
jgi:hypothetical protein